MKSNSYPPQLHDVTKKKTLVFFYKMKKALTYHQIYTM